jgi:hypothetical protein
MKGRKIVTSGSLVLKLAVRRAKGPELPHTIPVCVLSLSPMVVATRRFRVSFHSTIRQS